MVKAAAATIGAILGFLLGVLLAAMMGLHEKSHIFSFALPLATALSIYTVVLASKRLSQLSHEARHAAITAIICSAIGCVILLFNVIG
jgi:uncharacterized protein YacL